MSLALTAGCPGAWGSPQRGLVFMNEGRQGVPSPVPGVLCGRDGSLAQLHGQTDRRTASCHGLGSGTPAGAATSRYLPLFL